MNETNREASAHPIHLVANLLKSPESLAEVIASDRQSLRTGVRFLAMAALFYAFFGLAIGSYGVDSALMAALKIPLIVACSLLICYPSLYVFSCLGGIPMTMSQVFVLGSACISVAGFILIGLAPVAWLFSMSTPNLPFRTLLTLVMGLIAIIFVVRFIGKLQVHAFFQRSQGVKVWLLILITVTLQMITVMRPILDRPTDGDRPRRIFFLQHLGESLFSRGHASPTYSPSR